MSSILLTTFVIVGAILSVITLHSCWLASKNKSILTWVYPVVAMLVIIFGIKSVIEIQGYPIEAKPTGEWEYIIHSMEGERAAIILKENHELRTYIFKPTQKEKEAMEEAKKARDKGKRIRMKMDSIIPEMELIRLDEENPK